jgi:hypothetical protein
MGYISHRQLADALMSTRAGRTAVICGVAVSRLEPAGKFAPAAGVYSVGGSAGLLLLQALDELARQAGLRPHADTGCDDDEP